MKKKVLSVLLCCALICSMMATPAVQPPAHAEVVTLTVTAVAVVLTILAACGITFASMDVAKKCIQQFATDVPDVPTLVSDILGSTSEGHILSITAVTLPKVKQLISKAIDYFKGKTSVSVPSNTFGVYNGLHFVTTSNFSSGADALSCAYYSVSDYLQSSSLVAVVNGVTWKYHCLYADDSEHCVYVYVEDKGAVGLVLNDSDFYAFKATKFGFQKVYYNGAYYLFPYIAVSWVDKSSSTHYDYTSWNCYGDDTKRDYFKALIPLNTEAISWQEDGIPVDTADLGNADDVNEAIAHGVGKSAEGIQADIQSVIDAINAATATDSIGIDAARELLGIQDELKELEREQERIEDAIKEGTKEDDMDVPKLPTTITDKFPFCVPFDLIALVKTFSAEPVAPKVTVPVVFQSMNYSHDFVFDFSGDNWDKVAAVIRWGTLIFFILGLTLVTRKLIKG